MFHMSSNSLKTVNSQLQAVKAQMLQCWQILLHITNKCFKAFDLTKDLSQLSQSFRTDERKNTTSK